MNQYNQLTRLKNIATAIGPRDQGSSLDLSYADLGSNHMVPSGFDMSAYQSGEIEIFAQEVLTALISNNFPPTPNNFAIFFERILEEKSASLKQQIKAVVELDTEDDDHPGLEGEKTLKKGFGIITTILQHNSTMYKNLALMSKIVAKHKETFLESSVGKHLSDEFISFNKDISKFGDILQSQMVGIKSSYEAAAVIVKQVDSSSVFDGNLGIHNKKYFTRKLTQELESAKRHNYTSSILFLELSETVSSGFTSDKTANLVSRTISKLLLKTSRRSDVISHYGNGVFAILLKHTGIDSGKLAATRIRDLVSGSNFFAAGSEIDLSISIGLLELNPEFSAESSIVAAIAAMKQAHTQPKESFVIGEL